MLNDERKADLIEEKTYEKFVFGVWVKAIDDDDILAVAYNMVTAAGCACDSSNGSTWVRASGELNHLGSDPSRVILGRAGATSSSSVLPLPPLPSCARHTLLSLLCGMWAAACDRGRTHGAVVTWGFQEVARLAVWAQGPRCVAALICVRTAE